MTLSELLEGLKQIDPEEWEIIMHGIPLTPMSQYFTFDHGETTAHRYHSTYLPFSQMERDVALVWLQGCLQRACEKRGWGLVVEWSKDSGPYEWSAYTGHEEPPGAFRAAYSWGIRYYGGSAAEALLAAYVAAIKEEKR
jgi:hypothetical protein